MIAYKDLKVDMEVEAILSRSIGKQWIPARVVSKHDRLELAYVELHYPNGTNFELYRRPSELRLKPEGGT